MKKILVVLLVIPAAVFFLSWGSQLAVVSIPAEKEDWTVPLGLPPISWPADNPYSKKKAALGQLLYFDKRLSSDGTISCASCHVLERAFGDVNVISQGIRGHVGTRHAPTVINSTYQAHQFWDGRASSLEEQAKGPLGNPLEMTLADNVHDAYQQCHKRIKAIAGYQSLFKEAFGYDDCSIDDVAKAIATFERTVLSGNAPYDRYMAGDKMAMNADQIAGYQVFKKVKCGNCHFGANFTDGRFQNIGVGTDKPNPDVGRYAITKDEKDWAAFKTPTLREAEKSHPYMHDGSHQTLEEVVEYYDKGGIPNRNLHPLMKPLYLTDKEKKDLVSFLKALNGEGWQHFSAPKTFPE